MSNLKTHAEIELQAIGYKLDETEEGPNKWIVENILELLEVFSKQGHSGSSAPYCIDLFTKLARFEPLCPLTGEDSEWVNVVEYSGSGADPVWQNKRCSHVFKGPDGRAYDIDGRVFVEPNGNAYTNFDSRVYVTFPYTPKTEYVQVPERLREKDVSNA